MKNLLMTILNILTTILVILLMVKGFTMGNIKILSISEILEENQKLDKEIEDVNYLKNTTYKAEVDTLNEAIKTLSQSKQAYLDIASISTDDEIENANTLQTYAKEYLWNKLGTYATNLGVNLNVTTQANTNNGNTLNFTLNGSYVAIIQYVSSLENDDDLQFKIENFKLNGTGDVLTAVFTVPNISIKGETVTSGGLETNSTDNTDDTGNPSGPESEGR